MHPKRNWTPWLLLGLGAILLGCFAFYGFVVPQTPGRVTRPSYELAEALPLYAWIIALPVPIPKTSGALVVALVVTALIAFLAYGLALLLLRSRPQNAVPQWAVIVPGLAFLGLSVMQLPNVNTDIFNYIVRGRVAAVYHQNPYLVAADAYANDPLYRYAEHRYTQWADGKLPAWELMGGALAWVAGDDPVRNLLLFRTAFFLLSAGNVFLIYRILRILAPARTLFGVAFYAWNPIVAVFGQSKTDTVMLFYLLLGVWFLVSSRPRLAVIPLTLSVFVKLLTLPLVLIHWVREARESRVRALQNALLAAGVAVLVYVPFWHGPELLLRHSEYTSSVVGDAAGVGVVRILLAAALAAVVVWIALARRTTTQRLLNDWGVVLVLFSLLVSRMGLSWYLIVPIGVLALSTDGKLQAAGITIAFGTFLLNSWRSTFSQGFSAPHHDVVRVGWLVAVPVVLLFLAAGVRAARVGLRGGWRSEYRGDEV